MLRALLAILILLLSFNSLGQTRDWMQGTWVLSDDNKSAPLKKLIITRVDDIVTVKSWLGCDEDKCMTPAHPTIKVFEKQKEVTYTHYQAGYIVNGQFITVTLKNPMMTYMRGIQVDFNVIDPKQAKAGSSSIRMIEPNSEEEPCACVFNENRMWNPEKVMWNNAYWKCIGYKEDGSCKGVEKIKDVSID